MQQLLHLLVQPLVVDVDAFQQLVDVLVLLFFLSLVLLSLVLLLQSKHNILSQSKHFIYVYKLVLLPLLVHVFEAFYQKLVDKYVLHHVVIVVLRVCVDALHLFVVDEVLLLLLADADASNILHHVIVVVLFVHVDALLLFVVDKVLLILLAHADAPLVAEEVLLLLLADADAPKILLLNCYLPYF